jgi:hypothetical protein
MTRMNFVVAVSKNKKTSQLINPTGNEFYKVDRGLIRPVYIFKQEHNRLIFFPELIEEPGKKSRAVTCICCVINEIITYLPCYII